MRISKPSAPSGLKLDDLIGDLLLVKPLRVETGIQTRYGPKDAVVADVHVLESVHFVMKGGEVIKNQ